MNVISSISAVFRFEWKRSLTIPRMAWWVLLMAFPPGLLTLVRLTGVGSFTEYQAGISVYILCPCVVCMMGVFLWATPAITSELEGRSWVYLAVRPRGAISVLLGKYLVAVTWTLPIGLIASTVSLVILYPDDHLIELIWVQWLLVVLSCFGYAAAFCLIGVMFPKRTMVFGVVYAIVFELVFALIPAIVSSLTIQFRLRCLAVRWMGWETGRFADTPVFRSYFGEKSAWWHLGVLLGMIVGMLAVAALILRWREFTTSEEADA